MASTSDSTQARAPVLFLDNGGYSIKALFFADPERGQPRVLVVPNCVGAAAYAGKGIVGEQITKLPHFHGFLVRRPVVQGFIMEGRLQAYVWQYILQHFGIEEEEQIDLWLTSPFGAPLAVAKLLYVLVNERYHFRSVTFVSSTLLTLLSYSYCADPLSPPARRKRGREESSSGAPGVVTASGTALVVDVGFSGTTVVPYMDFLPVYSSIVRIDVGGKVLTNRLKEHISFTQVNVLEDGWLLGHIREKCCVVAPDPRVALIEQQRREQRADTRPRHHRGGAESPLSSGDAVYYLPTIPALLPLGCTAAELSGTLRSGAEAGAHAEHGSAGALQRVVLRQEAFLIPELVFSPADVGVQEMGVVQAVAQGVFERGLLMHLPLLREPLLSRVCVCGGVSNTPGFMERFTAEMYARRCRSGDDDAVAVLRPSAQARWGADLQPAEGLQSSVEGGGLRAGELQVLYGACVLLGADAVGTRHRASVRARSHVMLRDQHGAVRTTPEMLHEALQNLL